MKAHLLWIVISIFVLISCQSEPNPTIVYPSEEGEEGLAPVLPPDTTVVLVGELPIYFDSTDYLIFPVGSVKLNRQQRRSIYTDFASAGGDVFSPGYLNGPDYTGRFDDLIFQHLDSTEFRSISQQTIKIRSFRFLASVFRKTKRQLLLLTVTDRDTNRDGQLSNQDIESLYLYDMAQGRFVKLTEDLQELIDWKILEVNNRLYFRALEDTDKNGEFDQQDKIHHFYLDFDQQEFKPREFRLLN